jgi:anti-anti-sigma factor
LPQTLVPFAPPLGRVPPPAFGCTLTEGGPDAAWVRVAGELDIDTAPQLEQTLRKADVRARLIVIDLREVTFMDCSGLHVILGASMRATAA